VHQTGNLDKKKELKSGEGVGKDEGSGKRRQRLTLEVDAKQGSIQYSLAYLRLRIPGIVEMLATSNLSFQFHHSLSFLEASQC
jgi:hypothetical protein